MSEEPDILTDVLDRWLQAKHCALWPSIPWGDLSDPNERAAIVAWLKKQFDDIEQFILNNYDDLTGEYIGNRNGIDDLDDYGGDHSRNLSDETGGWPAPVGQPQRDPAVSGIPNGVFDGVAFVVDTNRTQ